MLEASVNWSKQCILFTKPFENCHNSILSKTKMCLIVYRVNVLQGLLAFGNFQKKTELKTWN